MKEIKRLRDRAKQKANRLLKRDGSLVPDARIEIPTPSPYFGSTTSVSNAASGSIVDPTSRTVLPKLQAAAGTIPGQALGASSPVTSPMPSEDRPEDVGSFGFKPAVEAVPKISPADSPVALVEPPKTTAQASDTSVIQSTTQTTTRALWTGAKALFDVLNSNSDAFGPLKSAVGGVIACIDVFEKKAKVEKEYTDLRAALDAVCKDLLEFLGGELPPSMTRSMMILAKDIERETDFLREKQERGGFIKYAEAQEDADEIFQSYRRIQTHLDRLALNSNMNVWKIVDEQTTMMRLDRLPNSSSAPHASKGSRALYRHACAPNTRVEVLRALESWAEQHKGQPVYWLNGMAGTGKTTISYSFCEHLEGSGRLAASFFCSRQLADCQDVDRIVPSIAYQLSLISRPFRCALADALGRDPEAYNRSVKDQFQKLIVKPLLATQKALPTNLVVVIDALDECADQIGVVELLATILDHAAKLPVLFYLTSRPNPKITSKLDAKEVDDIRLVLHLHNLEKSSVEADIKTYLATALTGLDLPASQLNQLAKQAGVLFIYAATTVRYALQDEPAQSLERLNWILSRPGSLENESAEIDRLYTIVLSTALGDTSLLDREKKIIISALRTVICAQEPLTVVVLAGFLGKHSSTELLRALLKRLASVIHIDATTGRITTLHKSFPDFLLDLHRSGEFHCDATSHHAWYARSCFDLIKTQRPAFNICALESSYVPDEDVPDIQDRIEARISWSLYYACRFWETHLTLAQLSEELHGPLRDFIWTRFLLWMEVMNLKNQMHEGAGMMHRLLGWLRLHEGSGDLTDLCEDCWRFIIAYTSSDASPYTPHIYTSALPFWPTHRPISTIYMPYMSRLTKVTGSGLSRRRRAPIAVCYTEDEVWCIASSPCGNIIASGLTYGEVCLWDAHVGRLIGTPLEGHTTTVLSLCFSPDGKSIASGSGDRTIRFWDVSSGETIREALKGHRGRVNSVTFSPNGVLLGSGSEDKTVRIWDLATGTIIGDPLIGHKKSVSSVAFSSDSRHIVSGSDDHTILIWDVSSQQRVGQPIRGHTREINSVACSSDGKLIISGSSDSTIRMWDMSSHETFGRPLRGHLRSVRSVAFSQDNQYIVSGSDDKTVRIWNTMTGEIIGQVLQGHDEVVRSVTFLPNRNHVVSGSWDYSLRIWDIQTNETQPRPLHGHHSSINSVAFSPNGKNIASGSSDHAITVWDSVTGEMVAQPFQGHAEEVNTIAFSPNNMHIVSGSSDKTIRIWDVRTGEMVGEPLQGHDHMVSSVGFSSNARYIVSGSLDYTIRMWDATTGEALGQPLRGHDGPVRSVTFSPKGDHIVSGSDDNTVRIWDVSAGEMLGKPLRGHSDDVESVACSPDDKHIISGSRDMTIRIWDAQTGKTVGQPLRGHEDWISSVAFSPSGEYIVSCSLERTIRVWAAPNGDMVGQPLTGHTGWVRSVSFSPDDKLIVSGSSDETIRVWEIYDGESIDARSPTFDWRLDELGWVRDRDDRPLVWVPFELRHVLLRPRNTLLIGSEGFVRLDFTEAALGSDWAECYNSS